MRLPYRLHEKAAQLAQDRFWNFMAAPERLPLDRHAGLRRMKAISEKNTAVRRKTAAKSAGTKKPAAKKAAPKKAAAASKRGKSSGAKPQAKGGPSMLGGSSKSGYGHDDGEE